MRSEVAGMPVLDWIVSELRALRAAYDFDIGALVPRDLLAVRPDGVANSIAWLVWHLARVEDVAINTVVRGVPQLLHADGWTERVRVADERIGTGFTPEEVSAVEAAVDTDGLDAYWAAVRGVTMAWLGTGPSLDEVPNVTAHLASGADIAPREGSWIKQEWTGKPARYFVRSVVIAHGYLHLGEMRSVRGRLGIDGL